MRMHNTITCFNSQLSSDLKDKRRIGKKANLTLIMPDTPRENISYLIYVTQAPFPNPLRSRGLFFNQWKATKSLSCV